MEALLEANAADERTQQARLDAVRGKKVLFITCFLADFLYKRDKPLFQSVVELGPELYFVFGQSEKERATARQFEKDGLVTGGILWADMADGDKAADNVVAAAKASNVMFDAVFCPYEHAMTLVGQVAAQLGIKANPEQAYINARDKRMSREVCEHAGLATPRFARVFQESDVEEAVAHVGLPLVLKPNAGASSDGVYRCDTIDEVMSRFAEVNAGLSENFLIKWSPGTQACVLLEEYIEGDEFDVDVLMWEGESVYANAIDNTSCPEPYFMETGSVCPTLYTGKKEMQLIEYAVQCVQALGFINGLFHVELRYSTKREVVVEGEVMGQPLLIEVNPRMGGGRTHMLHKAVYGVDIFVNFFLASIGIPINPPRPAEPLCAMGDYEVCAEQTGVLLHTRFFDHLKDHPAVTNVVVHLQAGAHVRGLDTGIPEWLGYYNVKASTPEEVYELIDILNSTLSMPIAPISEEDNIKELAGVHHKLGKARGALEHGVEVEM